MVTVTPTDPSHAPGHASGHAATPPPNDPTHDINGKAVVTWVLAWTAVLFVGLYGLLILFDLVARRDRALKVENNPNTQFEQQRALEQQFLDGRKADGGQGKSIDQVMQELAK